MTGSLRLHAPTALEYFARCRRRCQLAVAEAALSIAQDDYPALDCSASRRIDGLRLGSSRRIPADAVPVQRLRWLNRYFFQELGFAGNVNDYYDARNSYLHCVLETRRGIPITLALLYVELADADRPDAAASPFPGTSWSSCSMPQGEVVIDPFTGQSMSREALDALLVPYRGAAGAAGRLRRCRSALLPAGRRGRAR